MSSVKSGNLIGPHKYDVILSVVRAHKAIPISL